MEIINYQRLLKNKNFINFLNKYPLTTHPKRYQLWRDILSWKSPYREIGGSILLFLDFLVAPLLFLAILSSVFYVIFLKVTEFLHTFH